MSFFRDIVDAQKAEQSGAIPVFRGKNQARDTWAFITRSMWDDYVNDTMPLEEQARQETTFMNPGIVDREINAAIPKVSQAFDNASRMQQEVLANYGMTPSQDAQRVNSRLNNLGASTAQVDAANQIRQRLIDRDREISLGTVDPRVHAPKP